ncbi:MAG: CsgG/HfaB family protein [bacterium]
MRTWFQRLVSPVISAICLSLFLGSAVQGAEPVPDLVTSGYGKYVRGQLDDAIGIGQALLGRDDLTSRDSIAVFELLSLSFYARGQNYRDTAYGYLERIAEVGLCLNRLPQEFWPSQLCDTLYGIKRARNVLTCPRDGTSEIRTIAFLPLVNYSIGEYIEKNRLVGGALSEFLVYHFSSFGELDVVERSLIDNIIKEHKLVRDSLIDAGSAIRVGKLLGAHLMVFGSITQFDDRNARMTARVVQVETGLILTMVIKEGRPDFKKMEQELVEELAEKLELTLTKETRHNLKQGGTESMDALQHYAEGLQLIDRYDYKRAYDCFRKALEMDSTFIQAQQKIDTYRPLVGAVVDAG